MTDYQNIQLEIDSRGIATLWLNRPEKNNAFNSATIRELLLALDAELQGPSFAQMRRITRDTLAELYRADGQPGKADLLSPPKAQ